MGLSEFEILPGDCVFVTAKNTWRRRLIAWFTQKIRESQTIAVHVGGISSHRTVIESGLFRVTETDLKDWAKNHNSFEIWRNKQWTLEQRQRVSGQLYKYMNRFYGFWKLFSHGCDLLLSKFCDTDIFLFRRFLKSEKYPICSWIYTYSIYEVTGYQFNNLKPNWVDTDVMHDVIIDSKDWELIFSKNM